jgi:hypothetical protein
MHLYFGIDLINQIKLENPQLWTPVPRRIKALFLKAVELEYRYAEDTSRAACSASTHRCSRAICATSPTGGPRRSA